MAEIVNLRMARKARERAAREAEAQANRARHGRNKAEREVQSLDAARAARNLEGARRDNKGGDKDREP